MNISTLEKKEQALSKKILKYKEQILILKNKLNETKLSLRKDNKAKKKQSSRKKTASQQRGGGLNRVRWRDMDREELFHGALFHYERDPEAVHNIVHDNPRTRGTTAYEKERLVNAIRREDMEDYLNIWKSIDERLDKQKTASQQKGGGAVVSMSQKQQKPQSPQQPRSPQQPEEIDIQMPIKQSPTLVNLRNAVKEGKKASVREIRVDYNKKKTSAQQTYKPPMSPTRATIPSGAVRGAVENFIGRV